MNHIAETAEIESAVRAIVDGHALPGFVRGYDVRLDEFDGTPGVWITFLVSPVTDRTEAGILERGRSLVALQRLLEPEFLERIGERFPFYRFVEVEPAPAPAMA